MPELLSQHTTAQLRRVTLSTLCALSLGVLAAPALAQDVPAGLRACAAESDSAHRLACYDKEMARLTNPPAPAAPASVPPAPTPTPSSAPAPTSRAVHSTAATPAASHETAAPHPSRLWNILGAGSSSRLTAHVASLDRWPDAMVLHLDNGQIWQQVGRAAGDLSLQVGDSVTIEKHLGSYWLSARHVSNMQVRLKPQ